MWDEKEIKWCEKEESILITEQEQLFFSCENYKKKFKFIEFLKKYIIKKILRKVL